MSRSICFGDVCGVCYPVMLYPIYLTPSVPTHVVLLC